MITTPIVLKHFCKWLNGKQYQLSHDTVKNNFKQRIVGLGDIVEHLSMYITEYNNYYPGRKGMINRADTKELANLFMSSIK